jgi:hypothetical protein
VVQTGAGPGAHAVDRGAQCLAGFGEAVFDAWRHHRVNGPVEQPVPFEVPQCPGQRLVTDASGLRLQLGEPQGAVGQDADEQQRPLAGHAREDLTGQRVGAGEIRVGRITGGVLGHHGVPLSRKGAFFQFGACSPTVSPYLPETEAA